MSKPKEQRAAGVPTRIWSETKGGWMTMDDIRPTGELLRRLALASDALRTATGEVDYPAMLDAFYEDLPQLWQGLIDELPTVEEYAAGKRFDPKASRNG